MIELLPARRGDAALIFNAWGHLPDNFTHLTARAFTGEEDAERYLEQILASPRDLAFHIVASGSGIVGIIKASVVGHRAQVGYVIHRPFWGQGLATTALRQLLETLDAAPHISRIWATCALDNVASARVLEKCGFEREAILKSWVIYPARGDRAHDNYSYVKLPVRSAADPASAGPVVAR